MTKTFIVGILRDHDKCLAKQRIFYEEQQTSVRNHFLKEVFFPKGVLRESEVVVDGLERIVKQEVGVRVRHSSFVGEFYYREGCRAKVYAVTSWEGQFLPLRAPTKFLWIRSVKELTSTFDQELFRHLHGSPPADSSQAPPEEGIFR